MEVWHTASTANDVRNGWLGRLLDVTKADSSALWRAANVGTAAPLSLASGRSFVPSLDSVPAYVLRTDPRLPRLSDRLVTDWGRLHALQASLGGALALVSETGL